MRILRELVVVHCADVDSNNDGTIDPDNSPGGTDDVIEYDVDLPGKILAVNSDDDNGNGVPDYLDPGPVVGEDDLVPVNLGVQFENGILEDYSLRLDWE